MSAAVILYLNQVKITIFLAKDIVKKTFIKTLSLFSNLVDNSAMFFSTFFSSCECVDKSRQMSKFLAFSFY